MTQLAHLTLYQVYQYVSGFVFASSILGSILPPYEYFAQWPRFQAVYKVITQIVGRWAAINVKSLIYPSIASTNNNGNGGKP